MMEMRVAVNVDSTGGLLRPPQTIRRVRLIYQRYSVAHLGDSAWTCTQPKQCSWIAGERSRPGCCSARPRAEPVHPEYTN